MAGKGTTVILPIMDCPLYHGHEVSGRIVEIESAVEKFQVGDRAAVPFILSYGDCHYCATCKDRPTICAFQQQQQPGFTQRGSFAEFLHIPSRRKDSELPYQR